MASINKTRTDFFPSTAKRSNYKNVEGTKALQNLGRNSSEQKEEIVNRTGKDARVNIPNKVRDFARIKHAVDVSGSVDNTDKIANLKQRIQSGSYDIDYEALADKMISEQF